MQQQKKTKQSRYRNRSNKFPTSSSRVWLHMCRKWQVNLRTRYSHKTTSTTKDKFMSKHNGTSKTQSYSIEYAEIQSLMCVNLSAGMCAQYNSVKQWRLHHASMSACVHVRVRDVREASAYVQRSASMLCNVMHCFDAQKLSVV